MCWLFSRTLVKCLNTENSLNEFYNYLIASTHVIIQSAILSNFLLNKLIIVFVLSMISSEQVTEMFPNISLIAKQPLVFLSSENKNTKNN